MSKTRRTVAKKQRMFSGAAADYEYIGSHVLKCS